jgi:hypothetical protein
MGGVCTPRDGAARGVAARRAGSVPGVPIPRFNGRVRYMHCDSEMRTRYTGHARASESRCMYWTRRATLCTITRRRCVAVGARTPRARARVWCKCARARRGCVSARAACAVCVRVCVRARGVCVRAHARARAFVRAPGGAARALCLSSEYICHAAQSSLGAVRSRSWKRSGGPSARRSGGPSARRPGGPLARRPGGPAPAPMTYSRLSDEAARLVEWTRPHADTRRNSGAT